jgi:hypothetical protein
MPSVTKDKVHKKLPKDVTRNLSMKLITALFNKKYPSKVQTITICMIQDWTLVDMSWRKEREVERWHTGRTGSLTHARLPVRAQTEISRESAATRPPFPHYSHGGGGRGARCGKGGKCWWGKLTGRVPRPDLSTRPWQGVKAPSDIGGEGLKKMWLTFWAVFRIWIGIRIDFVLLDPDPYWECGSGSNSKGINQN